MPTRTVFVVALLLAAAVAPVAHGWVNTMAKRRIYLQSHVVRVRNDFTVENDGDTAAATYDLVFPDDQVAHLALVRGEVDGTRVSVTKGASSNGFTTFTVALPSPVAAGESATVKVSAYFTHALVPFPAEIKQAEPQLVVYEDNHYVASPYTTAKQLTTARLSSTGVESYSELAPVKADADSIKYGPYKDVAPLSVSPMRLHFANAAPFATFTNVDKEVEVSHWGNVAVEEQYDLKNTGAALAGGFARVDYQMRMAKSGSFRELRATLPMSATDVYYRDIIGNISTSNLRDVGDAVKLDIETRFPLFGGWKTQWYQGYNLPAHRALTVDGDTFTLLVDFGVPFHNTVTDTMLLKVVLPEGADVQRVEAPVEVTRHDSNRRFTYLDSSLGGRPVISMTAHNLIDKHDGKLTVVYTMPPYSFLREPLMVVSAFFVLFMSYSLLSRLDCSLSPKGALASSA